MCVVSTCLGYLMCVFSLSMLLCFATMFPHSVSTLFLSISVVFVLHLWWSCSSPWMCFVSPASHSCATTLRYSLCVRFNHSTVFRRTHSFIHSCVHESLCVLARMYLPVCACGATIDSFACCWVCTHIVCLFLYLHVFEWVSNWRPLSLREWIHCALSCRPCRWTRKRSVCLVNFWLIMFLYFYLIVAYLAYGKVHWWLWPRWGNKHWLELWAWSPQPLIWWLWPHQWGLLMVMTTLRKKNCVELRARPLQPLNGTTTVKKWILEHDLHSNWR